APAVWGTRIANVERLIGSQSIDESGFSLFIVPEIRVADPFVLLSDEQPRFDAFARSRVARCKIERECLHQHCRLGKSPGPFVDKINLRHSRQGDESLFM